MAFGVGSRTGVSTFNTHESVELSAGCLCLRSEERTARCRGLAWE